ncbi:MAG: thiolase family protein [Acidimicrobiales bacterium]
MPSEPRSGADIVLVAAARTPFTRFGGSLAALTIPDLARHAVAGALARAGVAPTDVDELVLGVNLPGSDRSLARQAMLHAGIPTDSVAYTVDRACCSSLSAITLAARALRLGESTVAVAGGAENMSRVPYFLEGLRFGERLGDVVLKDQLVISCPYTGVPRAQQAADEAALFAIGRDQQDEFALRSQQLYAEAKARGDLAQEIVPVTLDNATVLSADEGPRPDTSLAKLAALPTVNGSSTVTAGNAPGLSTGASAVVLMSRAEADRRGLQSLATLVATAMASGHPAAIASIPAVSAAKVLARAGMTLDQMDIIEINEAFAAVPLVATAVLGGGDSGSVRGLRDRLNLNGGAIAIGHPTGATAARLVMTAAFALARRGGGHALVSICGGIGEAEAAVIRVDEKN